MIDVDKWLEIFESIRKHKLRTFLTALSVWWGIFMLIILLGAGKGLKNGVEHMFRDDAVNSIWIYRGKTSESYKGLPVGRQVRFDNKDYDVLKNEFDEVEHITGRFYLPGSTNVKYNNQSRTFNIRCVHPGHLYLENTEMLAGRFINEQDLTDFRKVCVIGETVRIAFFPKGENPIGKYLNVKDVEYKIVGVYTDSGGENEMRRIYLPISTAQKLYAPKGDIHQIMVTLGNASVETSQVVENQIRSNFAERHRFSPRDRQAIYVSNNLEEFQEINMVLNFISGFIWFVGLGSIIAGVIGVSNIMLIVVKDRTKEIGIRKALGATPASIVSMIVQEAVFLTGIAGYIGLLSGFGVIYGVNALMVSNGVELDYFRNPEVNLSVVITALFLVVAAGVVAGLIPALQATRINPVTAMKA